jgi:Collagen triple helix repeat (20 copies)
MFKLSVVVAAGLLLCGASGYAIAQSGSAAPRTIKACAQKSDGALRLGRKCRKGERRVTWSARGPAGLTGPAGQPGAAGQDGAQGPAGANGANGTNGTNGTSGTSTGETFFASLGFGANFGGGGACDATPFGGPTIAITVPSGSYAQVMASVTVQRAGGTSNTACVRVDSTDVQFSSSTNLAAETRYIQRGSASGTTDPLAAQPLTFPLSAGAHTISMRYGSAGGTSNFSNRNLYVTVFHPTE